MNSRVGAADTFLAGTVDVPNDGTDTVSADPEKIELIQLEEGITDPRLQLLSHSSRTLLHKCPRKYQLYRLNSQEQKLEVDKEVAQNVTFAYGTAVGTGIQSVLEGKNEQQIILDTFLSWDTDLLAANKKQNKSFWFALFAVQKFATLYSNGFLTDWELVYYTTSTGIKKPAIELAFKIVLHNGYIYRGFIDAVLRHKDTGEIMTLEAKTSSSAANATTYKNSGQALGYSVVLDILFPELSSYTVLYLVYESKSYEFVELPFQKSLLQRALWLQELLIDTQLIDIYEAHGTYPMHGENCYDFFRDCEYLGLCTLQTGNLIKPFSVAVQNRMIAAEEVYDFTIDFNTLIDVQIAKGL